MRAFRGRESTNSTPCDMAAENIPGNNMHHGVQIARSNLNILTVCLRPWMFVVIDVRGMVRNDTRVVNPANEHSGGISAWLGSQAYLNTSQDVINASWGALGEVPCANTVVGRRLQKR